MLEMTLNEFARRVSDSSDYTIKDSKKAIITVMESLKDALIAGEEFTYSGFGSFLTQIRPGRTTYSNITHCQIQIPDRVTIRFKPSMLFKAELNKKI